MDLFAGNLAALEERSPEVARLVRQAARDDPEFSISLSADGLPIVERGGRPLDSRRSPVEAARRQAQTVAGDRVAIVGLGAGYFLEALTESGHVVGAVIESDVRPLVAAMRARDLRGLLRRVPVILASVLSDGVELACLKSRLPVLAVHGGCVAADTALRQVVERWPGVEIASRPPRVLVVGPILGGSLETARSTASAAEALGAEVRFLDFAAFSGGWNAFGAMDLRADYVEHLQKSFAAAIGDAVLAHAASWAPDLVLALAQAPLGTAPLKRLRAANIRTAFWFVENGRVLPYWESLASSYDAFFAIQPGPFLEQLRRAGAPKAVYLPTACDRRRHVPVSLSAAERARFASDVSFAGAPYLNRRRLAFVLNGVDLRLWGEGWGRNELREYAAEGGVRFSLDEMIRIFAASKINLNLHSAAHVDGLDPEPDYVNPRTFEIAACRAFQLVDHRTPLPDLFGPGEMAVFHTVAELRDQVRYYLDHADERDAMARRAHDRALAEHTFEHRVRRILTETLPAALVAGGLLGMKRETLQEAVGRAGGAPAMTSDEALLRVLAEVQEQAKARRP